MGFLLKAGAYLFHPLLMPLIGTIVYYMISPRYIEPELRLTKIFAVAIITFFILYVRHTGNKKSVYVISSKLANYLVVERCKHRNTGMANSN